MLTSFFESVNGGKIAANATTSRFQEITSCEMKGLIGIYLTFGAVLAKDQVTVLSNAGLDLAINALELGVDAVTLGPILDFQGSPGLPGGIDLARIHDQIHTLSKKGSKLIPAIRDLDLAYGFDSSLYDKTITVFNDTRLLNILCPTFEMKPPFNGVTCLQGMKRVTKRHIMVTVPVDDNGCNDTGLRDMFEAAANSSLDIRVAVLQLGRPMNGGGYGIVTRIIETAKGCARYLHSMHSNAVVGVIVQTSALKQEGMLERVAEAIRSNSATIKYFGFDVDLTVTSQEMLKTIQSLILQ